MGIDGAEIKRRKLQKEKERLAKSISAEESPPTIPLAEETPPPTPPPLAESQHLDSKIQQSIIKIIFIKLARISAGVLLGIVVLGIIAELMNSGGSTSKEEQKKTAAHQNDTYIATQPRPQKPIWKTFESRDEMTGEIQTFAISPTVYPLKQMDFPYSDVNSWIGIGCKNGSEWAFFGFNNSPNLTNGKTEHGYNEITARIKFDQQIEYIHLTQTWGTKFLNIDFEEDTTAISKIASSNKILLELEWHGQGSTYFEYPLDGARDAIAQIRAKCGSAQ